MGSQEHRLAGSVAHPAQCAVDLVLPQLWCEPPPQLRADPPGLASTPRAALTVPSPLGCPAAAWPPLPSLQPWTGPYPPRPIPSVLRLFHSLNERLPCTSFQAGPRASAGMTGRQGLRRVPSGFGGGWGRVDWKRSTGWEGARRRRAAGRRGAGCARAQREACGEELWPQAAGGGGGVGIDVSGRGRSPTARSVEAAGRRRRWSWGGSLRRPSRALPTRTPAAWLGADGDGAGAGAAGSPAPDLPSPGLRTRPSCDDGTKLVPPQSEAIGTLWLQENLRQQLLPPAPPAAHRVSPVGLGCQRRRASSAARPARRAPGGGPQGPASPPWPRLLGWDRAGHANGKGRPSPRPARPRAVEESSLTM